MSDTCEVVRVVSAEHAEYGGFKEINKSDLTPEHVLWVESQPMDGFSTMSVEDMRSYLTMMKVPFHPNSKEETLRAKCRGVPK